MSLKKVIREKLVNYWGGGACAEKQYAGGDGSTGKQGTMTSKHDEAEHPFRRSSEQCRRMSQQLFSADAVHLGCFKLAATLERAGRLFQTPASNFQAGIQLRFFRFSCSSNC